MKLLQLYLFIFAAIYAIMRLTRLTDFILHNLYASIITFYVTILDLAEKLMTIRKLIIHLKKIAKPGDIMKCIDCSYCTKREDISLMSRMVGYTAECSKTGTLLNLEDHCEAPHWCPLKEKEDFRWTLDMGR